MAIHRDLVEAELHEPKGVSTATADQVYISDGAGSGAWTDVATLESSGVASANADEVFVADGGGSGAWTDYKTFEPKGAASATANQLYLSNGAGSGTWTDASTIVSTYESAASSDIRYLNAQIADVSTASFVLVPIPEDCTINTITTTLSGAITVADATISVTRGGDAASLGNITIAYTGSAEGDIDSLAPASNNVLTAATHKYLKIATDGGSTTAATLEITIKVTM